MEWNEEKYNANMLESLDEMTSRFSKNLYGGFILAVDGGHIRAEVYKKGKFFYCFLNLLVPWSDAGWVRSGKRYDAQDAVVDALHKAGYDYEPEHGWCDGGTMLCAIGQEFGDGYRIFSFGRL